MAPGLCRPSKLSGEGDDLPELERIIKGMLEEMYSASQAKKLKESDKEICDANEMTVLIRGFGDSSKAGEQNI